jgi:uncharacterized protein
MDDVSGWCIGCLRTIDEICEWSTMSNLDKRRVWKQLGPRRIRLQLVPAGPGPAAS